MPEFLQLTIDKFTFQVATDRLYSAEGVWVLPLEAGGANGLRLGMTDFVQQHNGDVAFANIRPPGTPIRLGDEFAEIETMKVNVTLVAPVVGEIVRVNGALTDNPELINNAPYEAGWLVDIKATDWESNRAGLLDPQAYLALMQTQAEEELKS